MLINKELSDGQIMRGVRIKNPYGGPLKIVLMISFD
jgi:hypothetical protein